MKRLGVYKETYLSDLGDRVQLIYRFACDEAKRSMCKRHQIGAASFNLDKSIGLGHNTGCSGPCLHKGLPTGTEQECRTEHAERMLLAGSSFRPMFIVVTTFPCLKCSEALVEKGVANVYFREDYGENKALGYLLSNGVNVTKIKIR